VSERERERERERGKKFCVRKVNKNKPEESERSDIGRESQYAMHDEERERGMKARQKPQGSSSTRVDHSVCRTADKIEEGNMAFEGHAVRESSDGNSLFYDQTVI
jgi:hypothetical protein